MNLEEDYNIYNRLLQPLLGERLEIGRKYCSPIPRVKPGGGLHFETSGSFSVFESDKYFYELEEGEEKPAGMLLWRDWGLSGQKGYRPYALVQHIYPDKTHEEIVAMLEEGLGEDTTEVRRQRRYRLNAVAGPLRHRHLAWWAQYGVTQKTLEAYEVHGTVELWSDRKHGRWVIDDGSGVSFLYLGGSLKDEWQYYRPDPKTFWRKGTFIYGWEQLPYMGETLIIASGMKDGLVVHEATGLPFLAPSGESSWRVFKELTPKLRRRFRFIYTLLDPDGPGIEASAVWERENGVKPLPFRYVDHKRDIAALAKDYGLSFVEGRIEEAITKAKMYDS